MFVMISALDIGIVIFLVIMFLYGLKRGLVMELSSVVGIYFGAWGASHFGSITAQYLQQHIDLGQHLGILAIALTMVAIIIQVQFIAVWISRIVGVTILGVVNKLFGGIFSVIKAAFLLSCLLMLVDIYLCQNQSEISNFFSTSALYPLVHDFAPEIIPYFDIDLGAIINAVQRA